MNKYQPRDFKWRHFHGEVIMQCVRWYCKYGISYRDLEEMMTERGLTIINTDKNPAYNQAIKELKKEGNLAPHVSHLQIKYRNNRLEADHGKLKRLINPVRGFQSMKTAYATIKGFEVMRMFKKGQFNCWMYGNRNEVSFINEQFGLYS